MAPIKIAEKIEGLLGKKSDMKFLPERDVEMNYSLNYDEYIKLRDWLITSLSKVEDL